MKRILTIITTVAIMLIAMSATAFAAANEITVTIDGERVVFDGQQPIIQDGRTLVPIRGVFEKLGFDVEWIPDEKDDLLHFVFLTTEDITISVGIGASRFSIWNNNNDAERIELDVPARIINGRTMLPLRALIEAIGHEIDWNGATQTVIITTN